MQIKVKDWTSHDFGTFQDLVNKILNVEAMAMERETGMTFEHLGRTLPEGSRTAVTAFVWILRKREDPRIKFHEIEFVENEWDLIITDADERRQEERVREEMEKQQAEVNGGPLPEGISLSDAPTG